MDLDAAIGGRLDARLDRRSEAPIAVALSGGGDSTALLALVAAWAARAARPVLALCVDHRLHPRSAEWTLQAGRTAQALGARFQALNWTGPKPEAGLAAAARGARHALIAEAARQAGARVVLMGHTADDLMEAEAMRADGSTVGDPAEWAPSPAWPEGRGVFLMRPLLGVGRARLRAHLQAVGLGWIEDPANSDPRFARARARAGQRVGPAVAPPPEDPSLSPGHWLAHARLGPAGGIEVEAASLDQQAGPFLARALLCAAGGSQPPRGASVAALLGRLQGGQPLSATLAGARAHARGGSVLICREAGEAARGGLPPLRIEPGQSLVWDGRFELGGAPQAGEIRASRTLAASLPPADRACLSTLQPPLRPALPVFIPARGGGPALAASVLSVRCLTGERLRAACGVITHEREIADRSRGEGSAASLC